MRITAKLSTAGDSGHASVPCVDTADFRKDDGTLDEAKARAFLGKKPWCRTDNDDDSSILAIGIEFAERIGTSFRRLAEDNNDVEEVAIDAPADPAERRMHRGKFVVVSADIKRRGNYFVLRVGWANPNGAVGNAEEVAKYVAGLFARTAIVLAKAFSEAQPTLKFIPEDGTNCDGLMERTIMSLEHDKCERRVNGYCTPCKTDCPLYANGRCMYNKEGGD